MPYKDEEKQREFWRKREAGRRRERRVKPRLVTRAPRSDEDLDRDALAWLEREASNADRW